MTGGVKCGPSIGDEPFRALSPALFFRAAASVM
jgi:hypothetical protein